MIKKLYFKEKSVAKRIKLNTSLLNLTILEYRLMFQMHSALRTPYLFKELYWVVKESRDVDFCNKIMNLFLVLYVKVFCLTLQSII